MAFERHGTPEKINIVTFKCIKCNADVSVVIDGCCPDCKKLLKEKCECPKEDTPTEATKNVS